MTSRRAPALFNWAGSKALCGPALPPFGTYHEPFLGSGAAILGLASAPPMSKRFLSNVKPRLVNVFLATQVQPNDVLAGLQMHALLDSDVHFYAVPGRMNFRPPEDVDDCQVAADTTDMQSRFFHSTLHETRDGQISMRRRNGAEAFRARHQGVVSAAALLREAAVHCSDSCCALDNVATGDLVFLDPPYLNGDDQIDQWSCNVDRFGVGDVQFPVGKNWQ